MDALFLILLAVPVVALLVPGGLAFLNIFLLVSGGRIVLDVRVDSRKSYGLYYRHGAVENFMSFMSFFKEVNENYTNIERPGAGARQLARPTFHPYLGSFQ